MRLPRRLIFGAVFLILLSPFLLGVGIGYLIGVQHARPLHHPCYWSPLVDSSASIPGIDPALTQSILDAAYASDDLITELDGRPLIGQVLGLTYDAGQSDKTLAVKMFERFPLLFHNISLTIHAVTGLPPVYPSGLAPPAIMLDRPVPNIPSIYLDLISGEMGFKPPAGPCCQFKMNIAARSSVLYS